MPESEKEPQIVIHLEGGIIHHIVNRPKNLEVLNFDIPELESFWDEYEVCRGCSLSKKPHTHS